MEKENNKKKTTKNVATKKTTKKVETKKKSEALKKVQAGIKKNTPAKKKATVEKTEIIKKEEVKNTLPTKNKNNEKAKDKNGLKLFLDSQIGMFVKLIILLAFIIIAFIAITKVFTNNTSNDDEVTSGNIQYDEILISNIFKQDGNAYYVMAYEKDDLYIEAYNAYISLYKSKVDASKIYMSNLNSGFNKKYYDIKEGNIINASIDNLKFKDTTLVKINNGAIVEAYEGSEAIINHLSQISE